MRIVLSKSAIEAATMIVDDQNLLKLENRLIIESANSNLDYKEGKKLIELMGDGIFKEYLKSESENRKYILRKILKNYMIEVKPGFVFHITKGRKLFLEYINDNIAQLFNDSDLMMEADDSEDFKIVMGWWDELISLIRKINDEKKVESGREGEKKSYEFEVTKLKKLRTNKKPYWASLDNNLLGYDVESWDEKNNKIFIEAKSSSNNDGAFYLSRNEWNTALEKKEAYFIHVWIKDRTIPVNIDFERLYSKKYRIDDAENAEWTNINIKP